ncbi:protein YIPF6-like [Lytechinus variegatus]|uniref:protein YIPF6-like n=1 Tax=Lytechinus variegatus TaxID=7654 RepID=UPI001BB14A66|nr:protein YIPF6-like [Lytechinus variegatus]
MADVAEADRQQFEAKFTELELQHPVEGDITVPGALEEDLEPSTLDEPIRDTLMRDLRAIGVKFGHALYPKQSKALLRDWDLWGPLVMCTLLGSLLHEATSTDDKTEAAHLQFAEVFALISFGAVVVALNSRLLKGNISFFQSVCVLGYCLLPLVISLCVCRLLMIPSGHVTLLFAVRIILVFVSFIWSTLASMAFLADSQPSHRKALAMYPICLFYFVIGWMIISQTVPVLTP